MAKPRKRNFSHWLVRFLSAAAVIPSILASDIDSSALQKDAALTLSASGRLSTTREGEDWAILRGQRIWVTKPIIAGEDGYGSFQVAGGDTFQVFADTRVQFRSNPGNPRDLLDIETGRVQVQVRSSPMDPVTRIVTPVATIMCRGVSSFAIAVDDEDGSMRLDVQEGEVLVQHALLPGTNPVVVGAGDAIAVNADEPLVSRKLDRGSLHRYTFLNIWKSLESALPGRWLRSRPDDGATDQIFATRREPFCN